MDHLYDEMIDTLVAAQSAVRAEVAAQASRPVLDSTSLQHLGQSVRDLTQQADSLLMLMVERQAPGPLLQKVDGLSDGFQDAKSRIEALLAAQRRQLHARGPG